MVFRWDTQTSDLKGVVPLKCNSDIMTQVEHEEETQEANLLTGTLGREGSGMTFCHMLHEHEQGAPRVGAAKGLILRRRL